MLDLFMVVSDRMLLPLIEEIRAIAREHDNMLDSELGR